MTRMLRDTYGSGITLKHLQVIVTTAINNGVPLEAVVVDIHTDIEEDRFGKHVRKSGHMEATFEWPLPKTEEAGLA